MTHHSSLKLGLFGGSFDPVHRGHLALALAARRELGLDRVVFVPAARPPHKRGRALAPARHRFAMLRASLKPYPSFQISSWEIRHPGLSYTERTLRSFRRRFPRAEWFLLLGGDSLNQFTTWRRWRDLARTCRLAVGLRRDVKPRRLPPALQGRVIFLKTRPPRVSSSEVRDRLVRGGSVKDLIPSPAASYIQRHGLYRKRSS
jgi:nicotinate-nucleotide adenylyltransferase